MPKGSTPKAHVTYIAQRERKPEFARSESMEAEDPHCSFDNPADCSQPCPNSTSAMVKR